MGALAVSTLQGLESKSMTYSVNGFSNRLVGVWSWGSVRVRGGQLRRP